MFHYYNQDMEKVDKILDYLISLGGFDEFFEFIDDETFLNIQNKIFSIITEQRDPID